MKFYFTYGAEGHPFKGGWSEVIAPNEKNAIQAFKAVHPPVHGDMLPCAFYYSEERFVKTKMFKYGNFDNYCHEVITLAVIAKNPKEKPEVQ